MQGTIDVSITDAVVEGGRLLLYQDPADRSPGEQHSLELATLRRHKSKQSRFLVLLGGTYKNKNSKQEFQTENAEQTELWLRSLETAVVAAGRILNTKYKKLSYTHDGKKVLNF